MRIVHVLQRVDFHDGGPPRAVVDLCSVQQSRGHDVTLLTTDAKDTPAAWAHGGPEVKLLPRPALPRGIFLPGQLRLARSLIASADIVHLHAVWERVNTQVASVCRRVSTPYVITLRGMLDDWCMAQGGLKKRLYLSLTGRRCLEGAAFVHCTASGEEAQSSRWFPKGRARVIPNLIDLSPYQSLPGPQEARDAFEQFNGDGPVLLFLSRIHEKKGIEHLIDALPALREHYPGVQVLLAGTGDEHYLAGLMRQAQASGVEGCVHAIGHVGGSLKLSLYQAADCFVLPSSQENFGFVQFEALACATPVITTKLVDTWREVVASGGGMAVEQSASALSEALITLLGDADKCRQMGETGRSWVLETLATETIAEAIEGMYQDAIDGN
ncbi:MAG: glycosyltransferase [Phycisphaerales bacterium]|nr:glycosyltransferase [Phycisphaerales bacterium]